MQVKILNGGGWTDADATNPKHYKQFEIVEMAKEMFEHLKHNGVQIEEIKQEKKEVKTDVGGK